MKKTVVVAIIHYLIVITSCLPVHAEKASNIIKPTKSSDIFLSSVCSEKCHTRIYNEWANTMHAKSTRNKDAIVDAFYKYFEEEGTDVKKCDVCHSPLQSIYVNEPGVNEGLFNEGVNCTACHSVFGANPEGGLGIHYYKLNFNEFGTGPLESKPDNPHNTKFIKMFRSVNICAGCHQKGETDYILQKRRKAICQTCHMPSKQQMKAADQGSTLKKVYRHLFEGGHSELILSMTAIVSGEARKEGGKTILDIDLENSAYHTIPTGFPLRAIYLKVTAFNEQNKPIWSNYSKNPYKEDPDSFFGSVFNEKDELYAHYVRDIKPITSSSLEANSSKKLTYTVPTAKADSFQVRLYYRLLPERVIEKLNIDKDLVPEVLMLEEMIYVN